MSKVIVSPDLQQLFVTKNSLKLCIIYVLTSLPLHLDLVVVLFIVTIRLISFRDKTFTIANSNKAANTNTRHVDIQMSIACKQSLTKRDEDS